MNRTRNRTHQRTKSTKRTKRGFATTAALWAGGATLATAVTSFAVLAAPGTSPASSDQPAAATLAATTGATSEGGFNGPADVCTRNFSKDLCDGVFTPGDITTGTCLISPELCETTYVEGAEWAFTVLSNDEDCSGNRPCDQVERKSGRVLAYVDYTQRTLGSCPNRASLTGKFTLYANDGSIYEGTLIGTMAAGTHRESWCNNDLPVCERCLDAEMISNTTWRIGTEVAFHGRRVDAEPATRDEVTFSLSGNFTAPAARDGRPNNAEHWRFAGTADGVHIGCP